jgi:hypothetical protein
VSNYGVVLTYKDYEALPADGRRYEIHEGELSVTPAPGTRHQRILGHLYHLLRPHVDSRGFGEVLLSPVECIRSDSTIVQPDLVYLDPTRAHLVSARGIEGPRRSSSRSCRRPRRTSTGAPSTSSTGASRSPTTGSSIPRPGSSRPTAWPRARISSSSEPRVPQPWRCPPSPTSPSSPCPSGPDGPSCLC